LGEAAPLIATPAAPVPPGGSAEWFEGARGAKLRAALFPVSGAARGSVVLSGGRTEPIEKYFEVIEELRRRGFAVLAHDWRGQGLSQRLTPYRLRGHAGRYEDFLEDYAALLARFEARLPRPWIAMGHSMGGCLTALVLANGERRFSAAALSAPMFGILTGSTPRAAARLAARLLRSLGAGTRFAPGRQISPIAEPFEDNILTHDRRRYDRNQAQLAACPDLALGGPTWGWLDFAFRAMGELERGVGVTSIEIPVLVVAAGDDRLVDIEVQRRVTRRFPEGRFVEIPRAHHELFQERDDLRAVFWRAFDSLAADAAPSVAARKSRPA
jgi:lysophospholipase